MIDFFSNYYLWIGLCLVALVAFIFLHRRRHTEIINNPPHTQKILQNSVLPLTPVNSQQIMTIENSLMSIGAVRTPPPACIEIQNPSFLKILSPLLKPMTEVFTQNETITGQFFRLEFKSELIEALASGKFEIMRSGGGGFHTAVKDIETGKIVGQGQLVLEQGPNVAALASTGFQVVSFAVGQAHMAQITAKLKSIEEGVESIARFLDEQRSSKIHASIGRLRSIALVLSHPDATSTDKVSWFDQLLTLEAEMSEVFEHFRLEGKRQIAKVKGIKNSDTFGTGNTYKETEKTISEFTYFYEGWFKAYVLMSASRFIMLRNASRATIAAISDKIDLCNIDAEFKEFESLLDSFSIYTEKFLEKSVWNTEETLKIRRDSLREKVKPLYLKIRENSDAAKSGLEMARSQKAVLSEALNSGVELFAEVGDNGDLTKLLLKNKTVS